MASRNDATVYEILMSGWRRSIQEVGGGSRGTTLPAEWLEEKGIELGDKVAMRERDDGVLEVHPPDRDSR